MEKDEQSLAVGLFESNGLLPIIEAADVMSKTADVDIIDKEEIGAGLVVVIIVGDVAAVSVAIEAAKEAVGKIGYQSRSSVIPRLHKDVWKIIP